MPTQSKSLILYYTRTGNTRTVAKKIAEMVSCNVGAISSKKKRHSIWSLVCVFDQLFDRDDILEPLKLDLRSYSRLFICSPIWIHKLASPVRTFLKLPELRGKDLYLFITNSGNYFEEDAEQIKAEVANLGLNMKGYYEILTRPDGEWHPRNAIGAMIKGIYTVFTPDKPPEEVEKDTEEIVNKAGLKKETKDDPISFQ